jgi:hypothetical protein
VAKKSFRNTKFKPESLEKIEQMNEIIEEYQGQGLRMTARQLYYQFVSRDLIPNKPAEYKKLTALLTDARYAGMVDWEAIEDRGREPERPSQFNDLNDLVEAALHSYKLPRWEGQDSYAELWVEKQALAGVLQPLAREFHATLMVNKGYSSASAMKESAERIKNATITDPDRVEELVQEVEEAMDEHGEGSDEYEKIVDRVREEYNEVIKKPIILYLGDHDPSGEDMVRDITDRLKEFGVKRLEVQKVGLTMDQVKQYDPPPNPAKLTDPRAEAYIRKFGDSSWEVDALPPDVLARIIRSAFRRIVDMDLMNEIKEREIADKQRLRDAVKSLSA